jgi:hypothetical protein
MSSEEDIDSGAHYSIMDLFQDYSLCCQDTKAVEAFIRPPTDTEDPDREGIAHANKIMEKPWRPPLYRDTSLVVAALDAEGENQSQLPSPMIITPSVGVISCDDSIPSRSVVKNDGDVSFLPPEFIPPRDPLPKSRSLDVEIFSSKHLIDRTESSTEKDALSISYSKPFSTSTAKMRLKPKDVVCGRGAPTSIHPGNLDFKKIVKKHEMNYLCSTRSEKPKIAMKLLEEFQTQGIRFVKRERNDDGSFLWMEIGEQRSYEKICQSLREGAPKLRRQMMSAEAKQKNTTNDEKKQNPRSPSNHLNPRRQCQHAGNGLFSETRRPTGHRHTSSFSIAQTKDGIPYDDPIEEQENDDRKIEWLQYYYPGSRNHHYDTGRQYDAPYDVPYYVHLPPHLGGERLFRDRIE